ncbi:MAG TPA: hypothetical protein VI488_04695 [Candidatus Angelobacter sp.]
MSKIHVISQRGKLVGTWIPPQKALPTGGPVSAPGPGPGQRLHELEIEDPESYQRKHAMAALHKIVKKRLRLK